jgi:hypothetical protein
MPQFCKISRTTTVRPEHVVLICEITDISQEVYAKATIICGTRQPAGVVLLDNGIYYLTDLLPATIRRNLDAYYEEKDKS